jgi:F0F1-type ATP synthase membrane subunit b/b'
MRLFGFIVARARHLDAMVDQLKRQADGHARGIAAELAAARAEREEIRRNAIDQCERNTLLLDDAAVHSRRLVRERDSARAELVKVKLELLEQLRSKGATA